MKDRLQQKTEKSRFAQNRNLNKQRSEKMERRNLSSAKNGEEGKKLVEMEDRETAVPLRLGFRSKARSFSALRLRLRLRRRHRDRKKEGRKKKSVCVQSSSALVVALSNRLEKGHQTKQVVAQRELVSVDSPSDFSIFPKLLEHQTEQ